MDLEICYLVKPYRFQQPSTINPSDSTLWKGCCRIVSPLRPRTRSYVAKFWCGHTSTLLALAIFRDNDTDAYAYQTSKDLRFPGLGQLDAPTLTSSSWPNILPPKQQPTMLELAVELGNSNLVQLLLDADATVNPEVGVVPPLMMAVLHRHRGNVQSLLNARADPWQAVPVVLFVTTLVLVRIPVTTPNQPISCKYPLPRAQWIRWRIYFPQAEMLRVIEQQKGPCTYSHDLTAMTEHATLSWTI